MKKLLVIISSLMVLTLFLAACGAASQSPAQQTPASTPAVQGATSPGNGGGRTLPLAVKLALGTVMLDETDQAIDAQQAVAMLPLWKALRTLSTSETAATQETDAVLKQIQGAMTPEQLKAIEDMQISFQNMGTVAEKLGLEFGGGFRGSGTLTPEMQATREAMRQSGQAPGGGPFPGGGMPGGPGGMGGGPGGGEGLSPEARQTAAAERGWQPRSNLGLNADFLDAIIKFLEAKAQ